MSLTAAQKTAGRAFLATWQAQLDAMPAAARSSPYIREYRHACPRSNGVSIAVRMHEHYGLSPDYDLVPAGFFTFCWLDGKCACGLQVRSTGRIVLTSGGSGG